MIQTSTPLNGPCPDGERCQPISDLITEEDQLFSNQVRIRLKTLNLQPDARVVNRILDYSLNQR